VASRTRSGSTAVGKSSRVYRSSILVRFAHCDPAGIVFYPRYLEMFNAIVEDWCLEELDVSFAEIHNARGWGLPTVHLEVDYLAYSQLGETLSASLVVRSIGRTSLGLEIVLTGPDGDDRVRGKVVLVLTDAATKRAFPIPPDLKAKMSAFLAPGRVAPPPPMTEIGLPPDPTNSY
jgi:4-hydroxybenzoyl-CoA thioesterase